MFKYKSGQFGKYFQKTNWNARIQDLGTIIIGIIIGIYFEIESPKEKDVFLQNTLIILGICLLIKLAIYFSLIDLNRIRGKRAKKRGFGVSDIFQEVIGIVMGIAFGKITSPVARRKFGILPGGSEISFSPIWLIVIVVCIIIAILIESKAIDFSSKRKVQFGKIKPYLAKHDWNGIFHEFTSIIIGIGIGLYLFETGYAFKAFEFAEKSPLFKGALSSMKGSQLPKSGIFGKTRRFFNSNFKLSDNITRKTKWKNKFSLQELSAGWGKKAQPYLVVGIVVVILSMIIKFMMYFNLFDANILRRSLVGGKKHG